MTENREQRQLALIAEFVSLSEAASTECWLRGGWALDFFVGRVTRSHEDIDLFIWAEDVPTLLPILERKGFREIRGPPPEQQRNLVKDGEELHVTLLERNELGIVTAGGRWADHPWPEGMLCGPMAQIGGVRCRVISPEAQLYAKTEVPHALSHAPRDRDQADIALLREALAENARNRGVVSQPSIDGLAVAGFSTPGSTPRRAPAPSRRSRASRECCENWRRR